jgi:hypothetical protein
MPGKAYRLYPEGSFDSLPVKSEPEIQRSELSAIILQLKVSLFFLVLFQKIFYPLSAQGSSC